jgi:hypothetical protein
MIDEMQNERRKRRDLELLADHAEAVIGGLKAGASEVLYETVFAKPSDAAGRNAGAAYHFESNPKA